MNLKRKRKKNSENYEINLEKKDQPKRPTEGEFFSRINRINLEFREKKRIITAKWQKEQEKMNFSMKII
jgi:hypothetical protein